MTDLPTGYYLEHFITLLDTVESRYGDLLCREELSFLEKFRGLSFSAQRLYVRLVSRKGPVFRADRLSYPEIPDLEETLKLLESKEFLSVCDPELAQDACSLLTALELRELATESGIDLPRAFQKGEMLKKIWERFPDKALIAPLIRRFQWLSPSFHEVLRVFRLLFFGTPRPDLSAFVLSDLGRIRFESYPLLSTNRLFTRREEIDRALRLRDLRDELYTVLEERVTDDPESEVKRLTTMLPNAEGHPLLTGWRRRFLEKAGLFWEKRGNSIRALELYSDPETLPSRERRARLLVRLGKPDEALSCCMEILASPRDPEEEEVAVKLFTKFSRGNYKTQPAGRKPALVGLPPSPIMAVETSSQSPATLDSHPDERKTQEWSTPEGLVIKERFFGTDFQPTIERFFLPPFTGERIEKRVLDAFSLRGFTGFEAENRFWTSLFAILFWEIIYMPIPRAFGHPFQYGPADLFTAGFRPSREAAICARLAEITSSDSWHDEVLDLFNRKFGIANSLMSWESLPKPILEKVIKTVPPRHLAAICDRLSRNPGGFKTGFPDLFLFSPESSGYLLAEVKSPNDRLQNNQRSWLRYFAHHGIPSRVILVEYSIPSGT